MPIYSGNRSGSMDILVTEANMSYGPNDMARIMYESEVNDMKIFEAILQNDFREIKGIREGTILESELKSLNEASKKHLLDSLMVKSKSAWSKIKGAMNNAANAVAAYVLKDGKAYADAFENTYAAKRSNFSGKVIRDVKVPSKEFGNSLNLPSFKNNFTKALSSGMNATDIDKTALIQTGLQKCLGRYAKNPVGPKEFNKICNDYAFDTIEVNDRNVDKLADYFVKNVRSGKDVIKLLKDSQADTEKQLIDAYNELKKAAKDDESSDSNAATSLTVLTAAYETIVANYSKARIAIARKTLKYSRAALAKILAACKSPNANPDDERNAVANEARCDIMIGMSQIDEAFSMNYSANSFAIRSFVEAACN